MSVRRTFSHGSGGGWSAVCVHLEPAEATKDGFYLTLFPDGKSPQVVFLRPRQLAQLVDMAASSSVSDTQLWEAVSKIPLEPLLPNRSLSARLRTILVDQATEIRELVRAQGADKPLPPTPADEPAAIEEEPSGFGIGGPWKPPSNMP